MSDKNSASGGIGIGMVLFIVFLVLKLTGNIDWSWWWITLPLWWMIPMVLLILIFALIVVLFEELSKKIREQD
jgi:hypothetical protein